ncbi:hypothetical protein [Catenuloplanes atrovinosus]|uniref:Cellobiose-specific phosphotransferase system component IIC n=1 Tax=Catenuloplanes atrovinosus TaxID=137266 RepID=A0AAE3YLV2_9ACTN|nr:hypothetical protein [Catenuloplanes atrovinosus]MDR7276199.1 cellobiose-specific phosphotransferase system component IIC [Catenuloplanes atrovinosus]
MDTATVVIARTDLPHLHLPPRSIFDGEYANETAEVSCLPLWRGDSHATLTLPVTESEAQILRRSYALERFRRRVVVPSMLVIGISAAAWIAYSLIAHPGRTDLAGPIALFVVVFLMLVNLVIGEYLVPKQYPRIVRGDRIRIASMPNEVIREWEHLNPGVTLRERL